MFLDLSLLVRKMNYNANQIAVTCILFSVIGVIRWMISSVLRSTFLLLTRLDGRLTIFMNFEVFFLAFDFCSYIEFVYKIKSICFSYIYRILHFIFEDIK